ncbi:MAG: MarR family transcriptional regulator [Bacteroidia bacterium]|nr:MarR family transcriptional regulator [Bacteroidia bacterium]
MILQKQTIKPSVFVPDKEKPLSFIFSYLGKKCKGSIKETFQSTSLDRYHYMLSVICRKQKVTQQCLVNSLGIDKATVVRIIDYLTEKKLVKRSINPDDRREHIIIPTTKAIKILPKIEAAFLTTQALALKGFSRKELALFNHMLLRIETNMSDVKLDEK